MTSSRQRLGQRGEEIAKRHLESQGYKVLEANYRAGRVEIDLVAEQGVDLVFVEVRTRRGPSYGPPEESITPSKQANLLAAAHAYLQQHDAAAREWRIDVVAINLGKDGRVSRLDVIRNAIEL